jgi:hypothetical protein
MATSLKKIEKEFILTVTRDEGTKLLLIAGNGEWPVTITEISRERLVLAHSMPLRLLKRWESYEFRFVYREQGMAFRTRVSEVKEASLTVELPEFVYKNLGRRYSRRAPPQDFQASFGFRGDRYELSFPKSGSFDPVAKPEASADFDPADIKTLVQEFNAKAAEHASEHGIVMFKDRKPESAEERIIVRTGHILYLPSSAGGLPLVDPYVQPRIVTRERFGEWLSEQGVSDEEVEEETLLFERGKKNSGVLSELMIPILFQEYVIGYVQLVNRSTDLPPFDLGLLETFLQFAKVLAYSLKINGYFKGSPKRSNDFSADVIDVSAGGLLFANAAHGLAASLLAGSHIELTLKTGGRAMRTPAVVKRHYRDAELNYFGVEYEGLEPEDFRFLFESFYGRPFTDDDAQGLEGLGLKGPPLLSV